MRLDAILPRVVQPALGAGCRRLADVLNGTIIQNINLADRKAGIIFTLLVAAGLVPFLA